MTLTMDDKKITEVSQLAAFATLPREFEFRGKNKEEVYQWISEVLDRFRYFSRRTTKKERGWIIAYIRQVTGYSKIQVKKLIRRKRQTGRIERITGRKHKFPTVYTTEDVALLIRTDNAHGRLSGPATKAVLLREYGQYGKTAYARLAHISVSHLYNLRNKRQYLSQATTIAHTEAVARAIGIRKKPAPEGRPGFIRVDSVHQGDLDKVKGVYHVNLVDEVTQWEIVIAVAGISEWFLMPALEVALGEFPFRILGFHSDNGSEYINETTALLLDKLRAEQTKSRSRHTNDNALVEGKNGAVIRKHIGYRHIPKKYAPQVNAFYRDYFNDYLNFHRPSGFAKEKVDKRGKIVKRYEVYLTPLEKLCSLPDVEQ
jgi:transposase InsO family protein